MPLPWKKVGSRRISQLVNDHLNISQKRRDGSSLVVETGFPTSLIDLFIKNREKLRNQSNKKRQSRRITSRNDAAVMEGSPNSCPFLPPPPPPPPSPLPSLAKSPSPQRQSSIQSPLPPPPSDCASEICVVESRGGAAAAPEVVYVADRGGERGSDGDINQVLIGILKIFVVVVLALATKRLTVGITVSAVLLLFIECVGKHCRRWSKSKAEAMPVEQISGELLIHNSKLEKKQEPLTKPVSSVEEIQVLDSTEAGAAEKEAMEVSLSRERMKYQEIELMEMAMKRVESNQSVSDLVDCKSKSRKAKIKSKMKKIVPKKFRTHKKDPNFATPASVIDKDCIFSEEQVCPFEESENGSISSSISDCSEEDGKITAVCFDRRLSDVIEDDDAKIESNGCKIEAAVARRYMLLGLIVLAGLIGGRPFALVLTLLWFLLLKLGQAWPRIMSFINVKSAGLKIG